MHIFDDTWGNHRLREATCASCSPSGDGGAGLRLLSHQLLLRSKLIAMAVAVANIPLRSKILPMSSREAFCAKLRGRWRVLVARELA